MIIKFLPLGILVQLVFMLNACPSGSTDPIQTTVPLMDAGNTSDPDSPSDTSVCGNLEQEAEEACDDGNTEDGDYCSADCLEITGACGDGIVQSIETCDDGNTQDDDYCSADCKAINGACGDDELQAHEACDDGNTDDGDYCSADCTQIAGACGDSLIQTNELCDDSNTDSGDGCSEDCSSVDLGFTCIGDGPSLCNSECGDGIKASDEECEDGNTIAGDGCSTACDVEYGFTCTIGITNTSCVSSCGDGLKSSDESCDDGNLVDGDGCNADCSDYEEGFICVPQAMSDGGVHGADTQCEAVCGDGLVVALELCDDGNTFSEDGCSSDCLNIELGFSCEHGLDVNDGGSSSVCVSSCGDGVKSSDELCDDGNSIDGDGCSDACASIDYGYACVGNSPSECTSTCGDGFIASNELCDDGDTDAQSGCNASCTAFVYGYECVSSSEENLSDPNPSDCSSSCGDGQVAFDEACDDANNESGDGCAADCSLVEHGYACHVMGDVNPGDAGIEYDGSGHNIEDGGAVIDGGLNNTTAFDAGAIHVVPVSASVCDSTCGDGLLASDEVCDDGNMDPSDGCSADCMLVELGYFCETSSSSSACASICGDGIRASDEYCDDGPEDSDAGVGNSDLRPDACRSDCTLARCGDGVVDSDDFCDDANTDDTDACRNTCENAVCGDGIVRTDLQESDNGYEACDDGDSADDNSCRNDCTVARCGDGVVRTDVLSSDDDYEACDDGDDLNSDEAADACRTDCSLSRCGDNTVDSDEACDDGNEQDNDYCDLSCSLSGFESISAGLYHTCGIRFSGEVVCWGSNASLQSSPPDGVFNEIAAGSNHSCALDSETQQVHCWGLNNQQQAPALVEQTFTTVAAGLYHSCGILSDESAYCWGNMAYIGTITSGSYSDITVGEKHACGLTTDGQANCWGNNFYNSQGQLNVPALADGLSFIDIAAGPSQTCAVQAAENTTAGPAVCWGADLVNGLSAETNQPVDGDYILIALGVYHGCGILNSGVVSCWGAGQGEGGQYGSGQSLPYGDNAAPMTDNFLQVVAGGKHSCGLRADSTVICWGVLDGPEAYGQTTPPQDFTGE